MVVCIDKIPQFSGFIICNLCMIFIFIFTFPHHNGKTVLYFCKIQNFVNNKKKNSIQISKVENWLIFLFIFSSGWYKCFCKTMLISNSIKKVVNQPRGSTLNITSLITTTCNWYEVINMNDLPLGPTKQLYNDMLCTAGDETGNDKNIVPGSKIASYDYRTTILH